MDNKDKAIGVFDSGLGGISVFHILWRFSQCSLWNKD